MMRAPWSAAQTMPAATSTSLPEPVESSTLTGRIDASGATPDSARPLPSTSATVPATCVPCPLSSTASSLRAITFQPGSRRPARSGVAATPVSTTATTMPAPRVTAQAAATPMASRPHCCARPGSGVARSSACSAAHGLGEANGARAPQRAEGGSPMGGRHVHDDHAQARDSADLDGVCGLERRSRRRPPAAGRRRWRRRRAPRPEGAGRPGRRRRA